MADPQELMAEACHRGLLAPDRAPIYEEAVKRGLRARPSNLKWQAQIDANRAERGGGDIRAIGGGATLGLARHAQAAESFLETGAHNLMSRATGGMIRPRPYSAGEAFTASERAQAQGDDAHKAAHPNRVLAEELGGALLTPGLGEAGAFVRGAKIAKDATMGAKIAATAARAGRGAVVGGAIGGVTGATHAKSLREAPQEALGGAVTGAALGGAAEPLIEGGGALVGRGRKALRRAADAISSLTGRNGAKVQSRALQTAQETLKGHMQASGMTPERMASERPGMTVAEALGPNGTGELATLARRTGTTPTKVSEMIADRRNTRDDRLTSDIHQAIGIDPAAARAGHEAVIAAGRLKATPHYADAYAFGPMNSAKLENLAHRPSVKAAMRNAYSIAKEEGRNPEGLGLTDVEIPHADRKAPKVPEITSKALSILRSGKKTPSGNVGPSLLEFIGKNGGVNDYGGELRARDADIFHKSKPFLNKLVHPQGLTPGDMAQRAHDAGYFPEKVRTDEYHPVSAHDLYDAVSEELAGKPRYAEHNAEAANLADHVNALDERLSRAGIDPAKHADHHIMDLLAGKDPHGTYEGSRPLPDTEPAFTTHPTAQTWDYVKRGLDDVIKSYEDKTTGRLVLDNKGRAAVATAQELKGELARINPHYAKALATAGDYLSTDAAFKATKGKLFSPKTTPEDFARTFDGLKTPAAKTAARHALASEIFDQTQNKTPIIARFLRANGTPIPAVKAKLTKAFGADATKKLYEEVTKHHAEVAFENEVAPKSGSQTTPHAERSRIQDHESGTTHLRNLASAAARGNLPAAVVGAGAGVGLSDHKGPNTIKDAALGALGGVALRHGMRAAERVGEAHRNALGDLLMRQPHDLPLEINVPAPGYVWSGKSWVKGGGSNRNALFDSLGPRVVAGQRATQ